MLDGLEQIAEETSSGVKGNDIDGVIAIRAAAATLAFALLQRYEELGSKLPEAIQRWRDLRAMPNEFAEVRNAWEETAD